MCPLNYNDFLSCLINFMYQYFVLSKRKKENRIKNVSHISKVALDNKKHGKPILTQTVWHTLCSKGLTFKIYVPKQLTSLNQC